MLKGLLSNTSSISVKQEPVSVTVKDGNERSNTLLVKNIPSSVDEELLELFFESKKKQGGGPVDSVHLYREHKCALIKFVEPAAVETIMKKAPIKILDVTLDIQPYFPLLGDNEPLSSLNVIGLPKQLTDDILALYFDKNIRSSNTSDESNKDEPRFCQKTRYEDIGQEDSVFSIDEPRFRKKTGFEDVDLMADEEVFREEYVASWEFQGHTAPAKNQAIAKDIEIRQDLEAFIYEEVPNNEVHAPKEVSSKKNFENEIYRFSTAENLQIYVYKHSILTLNVDCIVNPTNEYLQFGGGVSHVIAKAAGQELVYQSDEYVKSHGLLRVGSCCTTTAGNLPYKCVIHTVGPRVFDYKKKENSKLRLALRKTLKQSFITAQRRQLTSIGTTSISSGIYGVPREWCADEYAEAVREYSREFGENTTLKSIHFVDVNNAMINEIVQRFRKYFTCLTE